MTRPIRLESWEQFIAVRVRNGDVPDASRYIFSRVLRRWWRKEIFEVHDFAEPNFTADEIRELARFVAAESERVTDGELLEENGYDDNQQRWKPGSKGERMLALHWASGLLDRLADKPRAQQLIFAAERRRPRMVLRNQLAASDVVLRVLSGESDDAAKAWAIKRWRIDRKTLKAELEGSDYLTRFRHSIQVAASCAHPAGQVSRDWIDDETRKMLDWLGEVAGLGASSLISYEAIRTALRDRRQQQREVPRTASRE
jgi:hypothetical protein